MVDGFEGKRVLVVEDEFFLADDLVEALKSKGAEVLGPAGTQDDAVVLLGREGAIDLAVLDINLKGRASFLIADILAARKVPFVFTTGYDPEIVPARHAGVPRWEKPYRIERLLDTLTAG